MTTPRPGTHVDVVPSLGPDDARAVQVLLHAAEEADGYPSISEQARLDVEIGATPATRSVLLREDGPGTMTLAGYAVLADDRRAFPEAAAARGRWTLEIAVRPGFRDPDHGAEAALVDAALSEVAGQVACWGAHGGRLAVWVRSTGDGGARWLADRGFTPQRRLFQLRAALPVEERPEERRGGDRPLEVRPFHPGRDEAAWLEVNRRAFAGHPEQGSWTLADLERREQAAWFDARGFLIYEVDRRIAGFCWTKIHRTPVVGEIYVIGVDPDFQGRGLGRALTLAGLRHLGTRGVPEAMLYVEEANTAALALYRSLGFAEHHRETLHEAAVPPASDVR